MKRRDALERIVEFGDAVRGHPFQWGKTDCVALALGVLAVQLEDEGRAATVMHRINWHDQMTAAEQLERESVSAFLLTQGLEQLPANECACGDLVVLEQGMEVVPGLWLPAVSAQVGTRMLSAVLDGPVLLVGRELLLSGRMGGGVAFRIV